MLKILGYVLQFWGLFKLVVRIIEEAGDENGWSGAEKLMHAKLLTEWLATKFGITLPDGLWTSLETVLNTVVSVLNLLGIFKHKDPAAEAATPVGVQGGGLQPASVAPATAAAAPRKTMAEYQAEAEAEFERLAGKAPTVTSP